MAYENRQSFKKLSFKFLDLDRFIFSSLLWYFFILIKRHGYTSYTHITEPSRYWLLSKQKQFVVLCRRYEHQTGTIRSPTWIFYYCTKPFLCSIEFKGTIVSPKEFSPLCDSPIYSRFKYWKRPDSDLTFLHAAYYCSHNWSELLYIGLYWKEKKPINCLPRRYRRLNERERNVKRKFQIRLVQNYRHGHLFLPQR